MVSNHCIPLDPLGTSHSAALPEARAGPGTHCHPGQPDPLGQEDEGEEQPIHLGLVAAQEHHRHLGLQARNPGVNCQRSRGWECPAGLRTILAARSTISSCPRCSCTLRNRRVRSLGSSQ